MEPILFGFSFGFRITLSTQKYQKYLVWYNSFTQLLLAKALFAFLLNFTGNSFQNNYIYLNWKILKCKYEEQLIWWTELLFLPKMILMMISTIVLLINIAIRIMKWWCRWCIRWFSVSDQNRDSNTPGQLILTWNWFIRHQMMIQILSLSLPFAFVSSILKPESIHI